MHKWRISFIVSTLWFWVLPGQAEQLWQANKLSLLYGERYRVNFLPEEDDASRGIVTLEHVSGHSWGDVYGFVDLIFSAEHNKAQYAELSPRLSSTKLFDRQWSSKSFAVKDWLLASTIEMGHADSARRDNQFVNVLLGIGLDWQIPGFRFLQSNIYHATNQDEDNDYQLTLAWAVDFSLHDTLWIYDGFIDWSSAADDHHSSFNWTSQLKWDLGQALWDTKQRVYLGIEYVYWNNKFGLKQGSVPFTTDERNINFLIKCYL